MIIFRIYDYCIYIYEIYIDKFFSFPQTSLFKETIILLFYNSYYSSCIYQQRLYKREKTYMDIFYI